MRHRSDKETPPIKTDPDFLGLAIFAWTRLAEKRHKQMNGQKQASSL
jgi:hypothetical protein